MRLLGTLSVLAILPLVIPARAQNAPAISLVANAEGENPVIAPNTWVEIKGTHLAPAGDSRIWQSSDFRNGQLPAALDGVSVTVNGKAAYVYYISPTQVNVLTPPDSMPGTVAVQLTNNGQASAVFSVKAQAASPSFFNINGG
ncbi:MAG TPA: IPT/TIG domain-containing protein, partial [Candidatus Acidoferrales bacterium]|nr:IPT/TIG domain-containing protein [Candidatus Acidoferrales bacterium]